MNIKGTYLFLFFLFASILTACGSPGPTPVDPVTIAQGFWDAINAKNVDAAMAFVADDVVTRGGPAYFDNKADFSAFMSLEEKAGNTFEILDVKAVSEDTITYTMKVYHSSGALLISSPSLRLQVKDGKIVLMEFPL